MLRLFRAELTKIRRSLIPLVVFAIPLMMFGFMSWGFSKIDENITWIMISDGVANFWVYFLLPISITVLTALMGQIEHRYNTWSYALSLPQAKWQVFTVKAFVVVLLMLLMSALVVAATLGAGLVASYLNPEYALLGSPPAEYMWRKMFRAWEYGLLLMAIQYWVAMRVGGMAIPLLFGIGGLIITAILAANSMFNFLNLDADYLPWLMPSKGLSAVPEERQIALLYGAVGGLFAFALASISLARKDWN